MEDDSWGNFSLNPSKDNPLPFAKVLPTSQRGATILTYKYETDPALQSALDKKKESAVEHFWKQHPMCTTSGKVSYNKSGELLTKAPMFNIVNFTDKSIAAIKVWRDTLAIGTKLNEMSFDEKVDLFHYYGLSPKGKTENELTLELGNFETGLCVKDADNFKKIWMGSGESDKDLIVNIRKALALNIIQEKSTEGRNSYYLGETFLGTAFNDILAYCKREEKVYNDYIVRQVAEAKKAVVKEPVKVEAPKAPAKVEDPTVSKHDIALLREELKQLKLDGFVWKGLNIENAELDVLNLHISKGREKKAKALVS